MRALLFAAVAAVAASGMPAWAQDVMLLPPPEVKEENGIRYVTGGIGAEERKALEAMKKDFNLELVFAAKRGGAFLADVDVTIRDANGREVLRTVADAPIFLAQLPAGRYTVESDYDGQVQKRTVTVKPKSLQQVALHFDDPTVEVIGRGEQGERASQGASKSSQGASKKR